MSLWCHRPAHSAVNQKVVFFEPTQGWLSDPFGHLKLPKAARKERIIVPHQNPYETGSNVSLWDSRPAHPLFNQNVGGSIQRCLSDTFCLYKPPKLAWKLEYLCYLKSVHKLNHKMHCWHSSVYRVYNTRVLILESPWCKSFHKSLCNDPHGVVIWEVCQSSVLL